MTASRSSPSAPRILIVLLSGTWHGTARLPKALNNAGLRVAAFCHANSFLSKTSYIEALFATPASGNVFPGLVRAVREYQPDLLIPGCELSVKFFHEIAQAGSSGKLNDTYADIVALVRRSLGSPLYHQATLSKHETLAAAAKLGLCAPQQSHIDGIDDAICRTEDYGYPVVLKGEFGFGGEAVRVCNTKDDIPVAYQQLASQGGNPSIAIQQYIHGVTAMHAAVAVSGEMLESFAALKVHTHPLPTSPCSVAKYIENEDTEHALSVLIKEYGFTGFCAADFIIESGTQLAYVLEFNPRPTPVSALGHLFGHNLCGALYRHMSGVTQQRPDASVIHDTVALFPHEWSRDARSPFLSQSYHDVPWDDPWLLQAIIQSCVKVDTRFGLA